MQQFSIAGWASGAPGSKARLRFVRYPATWTNEILAMDWPDYWDLGTWTSKGPVAQQRTIVIPSQARPGVLSVHASHQGGPLSLAADFRVCTLKPSQSRITRDAGVRLSGVAPVSFEWFEDRARVVLYAATAKVAGPPGTWTPPARTWKRIAEFHTSDSGRFKTRLLRPKRSTRYVFRFETVSALLEETTGRGYSSVCTVTVK